jgi:hypothetical protein
MSKNYAFVSGHILDTEMTPLEVAAVGGHSSK